MILVPPYPAFPLRRFLIPLILSFFFPIYAAPLLNSSSLRFISATPELGVDVAHVQGLFATEAFFFMTSVDKPSSSAWIWKIDRQSLKVVSRKNISRNFDFHPSGIDSDGRNIWVAVAVYTEKSHTYMMRIDPETLKNKTVFEIDDHIGAVALYKDIIIGANWNSRDFYFWTKKGKLLEKRVSPTGIGYQDCKGDGDFLMCVGGGYLDWINVDSWKLCKRFEVEKSYSGESLSREGAARIDDRIFFLPDDGPAARIYEYELAPKLPQ